MQGKKPEVWQEELANHPDQEFVGYILRGIKGGFRLGFNPKLCQLRPGRHNLLSAIEKPDTVEKYLKQEIAAERVIRVDPTLRAGTHCSPFGVIPKKHRPDSWRLIVDLSSPDGHSVNHGITKELATLSYVTVDEIVGKILALGEGALIAKMDIKQAYRSIPVHPDDRTLLGEGEVSTLSFGLRSAPLIFWLMGWHGS